jgi:hypothetical protein
VRKRDQGSETVEIHHCREIPSGQECSGTKCTIYHSQFSHKLHAYCIQYKYFANIDIDAYLFEYMYTNCKAFFRYLYFGLFLCIIPKSAPLRCRYARRCWDHAGIEPGTGWGNVDPGPDPEPDPWDPYVNGSVGSVG